MELTGVAGLVLRSDSLYRQLSVSQGSAKAELTLELFLYFVMVAFSNGANSGGVTLLGCLPPQDLSDPARETVPAWKGGWLSTYGRLIAIEMHFSWYTENSSQIKLFLFIQQILK